MPTWAEGVEGRLESQDCVSVSEHVCAGLRGPVLRSPSGHSGLLLSSVGIQGANSCIPHEGQHVALTWGTHGLISHLIFPPTSWTGIVRGLAGAGGSHRWAHMSVASVLPVLTTPGLSEHKSQLAGSTGSVPHFLLGSQFTLLQRLPVGSGVPVKVQAGPVLGGALGIAEGGQRHHHL